MTYIQFSSEFQAPAKTGPWRNCNALDGPAHIASANIFHRSWNPRFSAPYGPDPVARKLLSRLARRQLIGLRQEERFSLVVFVLLPLPLLVLGFVAMSASGTRWMKIRREVRTLKIHEREATAEDARRSCS